MSGIGCRTSCIRRLHASWLGSVAMGWVCRVSCVHRAVRRTAATTRCSAADAAIAAASYHHRLGRTIRRGAAYRRAAALGSHHYRISQVDGTDVPAGGDRRNTSFTVHRRRLDSKRPPTHLVRPSQLPSRARGEWMPARRVGLGTCDYFGSICRRPRSPRIAHWRNYWRLPHAAAAAAADGDYCAANADGVWPQLAANRGAGGNHRRVRGSAYFCDSFGIYARTYCNSRHPDRARFSARQARRRQLSRLPSQLCRWPRARYLHQLPSKLSC